MQLLDWQLRLAGKVNNERVQVNLKHTTRKIKQWIELQ